MPRGAAGRVAVKSSGGLTRGRTDPSLGPKKKRSLSPNVIGKRFSQGGRREGGGRISTRGTGPTDEFKAEVAGLRSALKERHRRTMEAQRCLLNPDGGKLYMWDGVTTSALAYTALVTPIEVAFVGNDGGVDGWFVINRVIDLIFIADFIIQFFIMVPAPKSWTQGETGLEGKPKGPMVASHGIYYVTDHREIAKAYIASVWFTLDIFSVRARRHRARLWIVRVLSREHGSLLRLCQWTLWSRARAGPPLNCGLRRGEHQHGRLPARIHALPRTPSIPAVQARSPRACVSHLPAYPQSHLALAYHADAAQVRARRYPHGPLVRVHLRDDGDTSSKPSRCDDASLICRSIVRARVPTRPMPRRRAAFEAHAKRLRPRSPTTDTYWFTRDFCWDESRGPASNASEALAELAKTEGFLGACQVDPLNFYIASFTWAIMVITGTGGTDEFPSATSVGENVVIVVLVMIAALIWTMVLATFW